jgi:hypothetical protein
MKIAESSIRLLICAVACLLVALPLQAATSETLDLGDGLYAFRYGEQQSLFLVGDDRVIATDPLSSEAAKAYKSAIRQVTKKRITHVAYTSSFFDRVPGGRELAGRRAEFVAQENCKTNLEATPHPDAVVPTQTYTDQMSIDAGAASLDLYYFGQSYGTCLSVMIFKPANVMLVHGLVTPPVAKVPDDPTLANYYLHNLVQFFVYVEELAAAEGVTQVVGSVAVEGEDKVEQTLAPVTLITEQREFWDTLLGIIEAEYNKGTPARAIGKQADMTPLEGYAGYDPRHIEIMTRRIYSLYRIGR